MYAICPHQKNITLKTRKPRYHWHHINACTSYTTVFLWFNV